MNRESKIQQISADVLAEALATTQKWPPFHSVHEGYAVILEELDELWGECRKSNPVDSALRQEAIQVAAMAIRFAAELTSDEWL